LTFGGLGNGELVFSGIGSNLFLAGVLLVLLLVGVSLILGVVVSLVVTGVEGVGVGVEIVE